MENHPVKSLRSYGASRQETLAILALDTLSRPRQGEIRNSALEIGH